MEAVEMYPLGDQAVVVQVGKTINEKTNQLVRALCRCLDEKPFPGLVEYTPAFTTVTVFYDPVCVWMKSGAGTQKTPFDCVKDMLEQLLPGLSQQADAVPRTVEIPVCYGGEFGPDLEFVALHNGLTCNEVVKIHSEGEYLVYMIGFAPGFPYLGGLSEQIAAPRRTSPRLKIPAGSVGIAGVQTGVYSIETPGGWQLIGRTPVALFRPHDEQPSLLQAGDKVRFRPISREEYDAWKEQDA